MDREVSEMITSKRGVLIALIIPIIALMMLASYKRYIFLTGEQVALSITGYDPRDLLSGHYVEYTIDYGVKDICRDAFNKSGYICLNPKMFTRERPYHCSLFIKGNCNGSRFEAGIERYYVPEKDAKRLEELIRSQKASVVLSVLKNGKAQVKDLLVNGQSWKGQE